MTGNFSDIVLGAALLIIAGAIYKRTKSGRIVLLVIVLFLIGLYLFIVGLGIVAPFM